MGIRVAGVVVNWFSEKGYGFIRPDGKTNGEISPAQLFAHKSNFCPGLSGLADGMRVTYVEGHGDRGPKAIDVRAERIAPREDPTVNRREKF